MPISALRLGRPSRLALVLIVLIGGLLRFYALDHLPPGLYQDEGVEGYDALRVLHGEFPIYFETNNGREPAFMYFLAIGIAVLGRSPLAVRGVAAAAGTLAIPIAYLAIKELFQRRVALVAAFIFATTLWPVQLSRLGLRSSMLPAALGLGLWGLARAWRRNRGGDWLLAGFLFGLSLYIYLPARLALAVPVGVALIGWFTGIDRRKLLRGGALFVLAYGLTALPLGLYAVGHWEIVSGRSVQVSILNPANNHGDLLGTLLQQSILVVRMFFVQGDSNLRHNIPGRPVFDVGMSLASLAGLAVSLTRLRERRWQATWIWLGVFLAPTVLADSAPHFLRGYGVWPVLAIWPAVGVVALFDFARRRVGIWVSTLLPAGILAAALLGTVNGYFWTTYLTSRDAYYAFDTFAADLAAEVNRFTGIGWQGPEPSNESVHGDVWIDPRLYQFTKSVEFLIPQQPSTANATVHLLTPDTPPITSTRSARLIVIPGEEARYVALLPRDSLMTVHDGSQAKATAADTPFLLFRSITAEPAVGLTSRVACFGSNLELLQPQVSLTARQVTANLLWRMPDGTLPAYTVFVHLYQDGLVVGQSDSYPANGLFSFAWLRPGDVVRDTRSIRLDPGVFSADTGKIGVGVYDAGNGQRQPVTDCAGQALGDEVFIR